MSRKTDYSFFSCSLDWASICFSQLSIVSEIKLINILTTALPSMSVVKPSLLQDLSSKISPDSLKALADRLHNEPSPATNHNKSPEFYSTKTSFQTTQSTGLRRPVRHKQISRGDSPLPNPFSKTVGTTSLQPNKQRAVFYRLEADLPNLHSQDLLNTLYSPEAQPQHSSGFSLVKFHNINRSLSAVDLSNLRELQLYYCNIESFRSLGTGWKVRSLTIVGSALTDLGGVSGFALVEDLFLAYNRISDVSHLSYHQTLRSLDLEGNAVADLEQVDYLETIENLEYLNLEYNPVLQHRQSIEGRFGHRLDQGYRCDYVEDEDIWESYEGFEEVGLIEEINSRLLQDRQNSPLEVILSLQHAENTDPHHSSSPTLAPLHTLHKPTSQLSEATLAYLDDKLLNCADGSRSRSRPKLSEILSKDRLSGKDNPKDEDSELKESQMRESIRSEARKKFLVRKGSMRKEGGAPVSAGLGELNVTEGLRGRSTRFLLKSCLNRL